jgi:hypothetical protein
MKHKLAHRGSKMKILPELCHFLSFLPIIRMVERYYYYRADIDRGAWEPAA